MLATAATAGQARRPTRLRHLLGAAGGERRPGRRGSWRTIPGFATLPWRDAWAAGVGGEPPLSADGSDETLLLTPARHGTDGFFIAVLRSEEIECCVGVLRKHLYEVPIVHR